MTRVLYDLAAADPDLRFSPYCWRTKLALAHKNLAYETVPWRFTDKQEIAFSGQTQVPVLVDGETIVTDSQKIAEYLEMHYPNEASLFGDPPSRALTMFIAQWANTTLHPAIAKVVLPDIFPQLAPKDQPYFRKTRETAFGKTIETMMAERDDHMPALKACLVPIRKTLETQKFIAGTAPSYADHVIFGALQWGRSMMRGVLIADDDVIAGWMTAVMETYGL